MRLKTKPRTNLHQVVIVGGGAGGLELATRLGDKLGRKGKAEITLIDRTRTHVWKPLLHEIAAGSMNPDKHELEYLAQAHWHNFHFRLGEMDGLDRAKKEIATKRQVVVVEGYTDVMAAHLAGVTTAVATCGTAFGDDHIKILRNLLMDDDAFRGAGDADPRTDDRAAGCRVDRGYRLATERDDQ